MRFALRWFERFTQADDFATWTRHLPPPLSPVLMRGAPMNHESRRISGFPEPFLEELARWIERAPGS